MIICRGARSTPKASTAPESTNLHTLSPRLVVVVVSWYYLDNCRLNLEFCRQSIFVVVADSFRWNQVVSRQDMFVAAANCRSVQILLLESHPIILLLWAGQQILDYMSYNTLLHIIVLGNSSIKGF